MASDTPTADTPADAAAAPAPTLFQLTPLNPAYREDPYAMLADMRARCPVTHDAVMGSFLLTRYSDVRPIVSDLTLWRDPLRGEEDVIMRRFGEDAAAALSGPRGESSSILTLDDPDHARIRQPLAQMLNGLCKLLLQQYGSTTGT